MTRRLVSAVRSERGFTITELAISMALIGVIFAIYSVTMSSTIRTSAEVQDNSVLQGEVRATVEAIAKDLRQAYTGNGSPGIELMTGAEIRFLSPDRQTPFHLRRISYKLVAKGLERASATSTNTAMPPWNFPPLSVAQKQVGSIVNTTVFTYYTADGAVATQASDVASVNIKLVVNHPENPARQFTYATSVALRVQQ